jgi:Skp family chaperone for outer membrane proteins
MEALGAKIAAWALSNLFKILGVVGAIASLVLGFQLLLARIEVGRLNHDNAALHDRIENPKTGYVAELAQCRTNKATLQGALDDQTAEVRKLSDEGVKRLDAATRKLSDALKAAGKHDAIAQDTLTRQPQGADSCSRMLDIQKHYQGQLH